MQKQKYQTSVKYPQISVHWSCFRCTFFSNNKTECAFCYIYLFL